MIPHAPGSLGFKIGKGAREDRVDGGNVEAGKGKGLELRALPDCLR